MQILEYLSPAAINHFIKEALEEDIRDGDHSSLAAVPAHATSKAQLIVKDDGIIAGLEMAKHIFAYYDNSLNLHFFKKDGEIVKKGDIGFSVEGSARSILSCERLVLNCLQRMSGIASYTHDLKARVAGTKAQLLDTRKTTPNFRLAEKWAVTIGGGKNHRYGLFDMIMLKDNHIDFAGGIKKAILSTQEYLREKNKNLRIEIETRNLEEVKEVLATGGIDVIMLDNMGINDMTEAVNLVNGRYDTEASGGITEDTISAVAHCGVDYISVGALTHSARSLDISLKAV